MDSKKPTIYFKQILSTLSERKKSFYKDIQGEYEIVGINKEEESFTYKEPNEKGVDRELTIYLADELKRDLDRAYDFYQDVVNYDSRQDIPEDKFLRFHKQLLKELRVKYTKEILANPIIERYLQKCEKFLLELTHPEEYYVDTSLLSNNKIIDATFSYLKGKNEKEEQIMTIEEYSRMMKMVYHLIEEEESPSIERRIEKINLKKDLLKFTFWVLHMALYNTSSIKDYFYDFLLEGFEDFKGISPESLKSSIRRGKNSYPYSFIPLIIKQYLEK